MSIERSSPSALLICNEDDDTRVLVVGGYAEARNGVELLSSRLHRTQGRQNAGGVSWSWRTLSPMLNGRWCHPGMLLLGKNRVLVVGGDSKTAEIFHLPRDDNDKGVWTCLTNPMSRSFFLTFLVNLSDHIFAFGESIVNVSRTSLLIKSRTWLYKSDSIQYVC